MAIRFDEEYDPERSGAGLRPMGRNAAGNRGISLKKGDYVIGAAITDSDAIRDKERDDCAAKVGLTKELAKLRQALEQSRTELQKARENQRAGANDDAKLADTVKKLEKRRDDAEAALKDLDEKLGMPKSIILTVTENGFGKRTDVDEYRLTARGAQGVNNLKATPKVGKTCFDSAGQRDLRAGRHQPVGQDHPHRHQDRPRRRPRHAGRPPAQPRGRRQGSRRRHHSARRTERKAKTNEQGTLLQ